MNRVAIAAIYLRLWLNRVQIWWNNRTLEGLERTDPELMERIRFENSPEQIARREAWRRSQEADDAR